MKKYFITIMILLFGTLLLSACQNDKEAENSSPPKVDLKDQIPIILIHGSGGDTHSLDEMADQLMNEYKSSNEAMSMSISADGDITYQGELTKDAKRPIIKFAFDQNQATPDDWSQWLKIAMVDLKDRYGFTQMDGVGHSNGGLALTYFAEDYGKDETVPTLRKIVAIGSPFNDLDPNDNGKDLTFKKLPNSTAQLDYFMEKQQDINPNLEVLAIAGELSEDNPTDGVVPTNSSLATRLFMPGNAKAYIEDVQVGKGAVHQTLHETTKSIEKTHWFLEEFKTDETLIKLDYK
ncbi:alpha/beta hydrolase [Listeria cossartiae subsp. cayugensis]|uniref:Alpha/beta hydrolase n=1 Tax=Listeria cossartiae subsp. cayugensis TaxID=2713505 RepID=A0ABU2IR72_9LIST|nr:alpha/beta hydrolase [Listeria cossartiae]MDT0001510.1 alpha/beta hydrolase [Listeria cossartiae subsp. cayugensis]MDT0004300.1 alpha/beta hydrolase [Listeria cossartiae subsp. cayugensis]MDT0009709.1 alpha/beta hydrolase [Listeria cossartiae subsp. cayugensis]MDT0020859.1 alpha/beta hydrolase [Listeria cossartiae subsp. cayugensis]MDT0031540.1 alpha/beta hydrolase [Listeria cossartiae subsp. cayugensis]